MPQSMNREQSVDKLGVRYREMKIRAFRGKKEMGEMVHLGVGVGEIKGERKRIPETNRDSMKENRTKREAEIVKGIKRA